MITFSTRSGSMYEVDLKNNRCRRLHGKLAPRDRQGIDGQWQEYTNSPEIQLDKGVLFTWNRRGPDDEMVQPATLTSPVKEILIVNAR